MNNKFAVKAILYTLSFIGAIKSLSILCNTKYGIKAGSKILDYGKNKDLIKDLFEKHIEGCMYRILEYLDIAYLSVNENPDNKDFTGDINFYLSDESTNMDKQIIFGETTLMENGSYQIVIYTKNIFMNTSTTYDFFNNLLITVIHELYHVYQYESGILKKCKYDPLDYTEPENIHIEIEAEQHSNRLMTNYDIKVIYYNILHEYELNHK